MPNAGDRKQRPLEGGTQLEGELGEGRIRTGTLGLVIERDGAHYILTAGHVVGADGQLVGQPNTEHVCGRVHETYLGDGVDIAQVKVAAGVTVNPGYVWTGEGQHIRVTFEHETRPAKDDTIFIQGKNCGPRSAKVVYPEVNIETPSGELILGACIVRMLDGSTTEGDSGAPWLSALKDGAKCWGVHGGKVKIQGETFDWFNPFECISWDTERPRRAKTYS